MMKKTLQVAAYNRIYTVNCALFCDSSLLIMIAKDEKSDVFSYCEKSKGDVFARSHTKSSNKGL